MEVVAGGGQDSVGGVAPAIPEIVTAHAMLDFEMAMTGSTADLRRNWRLIWGVTPRFWPEMKILNLQSGGALWPRYPLVGEDTLEGVADHGLHVRDHGCQGVTIIGIARQRLTWVTNWPPLEWLMVVATETLTPNS